MNNHLLLRKIKDKIFKTICRGVVLLSALFMIGFFTSIALEAYKAFWVYKLEINSSYKSDNLHDSFTSLYQAMRLPENEVEQTFIQIFSNRSDQEFEQQKNNHALEMTISGKIYQAISSGQFNDQLSENFIRKAFDLGIIKRVLSLSVITNKESRDPEFAGVLTASVGSMIAIGIALITSLPLALFSAIYLEEMLPKNAKISAIIRTNIANLASVPSIVYGIVGYTVYIEFFGLPRSSSLVAGLTLMLMAIPNLIIIYGAALRIVPPSVRNAAIALGLTQQQVIFHHVVPYCIPGFVTGTLMVIARIFGETAPLLMIGMAAFIVDLPGSVMNPATVLPMQIYLWADSPEFEFVIKSSAAIIVLLLILMIIGIIALKMRNKYTIKW